MNRFKKILCYVEPVDQVESALLQAVDIARLNAAQITLVGVIKEIPVIASNLQQAYIDMHRKELESLVQSMDLSDVTITIEVLVGNLGALHVIKTVIEDAYDLVIKPADNTNRGQHILFGNNDQHLLRKCPVPVWITRPQKKQHPARILAAIDVDPSEEENTELNHLIMQLAISLANEYDSKLHVVHAWQLYGEDILRGGRSFLPQSEVDHMVEQAKRNHKTWMNAFLRQCDFENVSVNIHLQQGEPDEVISQLVREKNIDLTVMGTVARTGIPGFFIGNTAEKILQSINTSVLAVKPAGFRTPVY